MTDGQTDTDTACRHIPRLCIGPMHRAVKKELQIAYMDEETFVSLYKALVRSHLEYAAAV